MQGSELPFLNDWQNFYMLIGTAAATLTGLLFVGTTLMVGFERQAATLDAGIAAFNTPTIAHFCMVLLLAGMLSAPWQTFSSVRLLLGLLGLGMALYLFIVMRRLRQMPDYQTPLKDWLWYMALPLTAYIALIVAALVLPANPALALYIIGAVMVGILLLALHNAWDLVIFLAVQRAHPENKSSE